MEHFFQFLMLNISSIKEVLHKPSEIQWNITGTLRGKLKRKISWAFSYKLLHPEITKTWEIATLGVLCGSGNQCGIQWFFMILLFSESFSHWAIFFKEKVIFITGMLFFLLLPPENEFLQKFWTMNAHNNEEFTFKH